MPATPTMRRRMLGAELRKSREGLGLTVDQAAERLGWHQSKVSRVETGRSGVRANEVGTLLDAYEINDPQTREALATLAREGKRRVWWAPYSDVITHRYASFIAFEAEAASVRSFQTTLVHGLLQTPEYARAVTNALQPGTPQDEIDALVNVRLARQNATLRRADPLKVWAIMDEAVLRREIGGAEVMTKQLRHLREASEEPNITVQVLPYQAGAHAGLHGSFTILEFPVRSDLDVVYADSLTSNLYLERDEDLALYSEAFDRLRAAALDVAPSRELIAHAIKDLQ
ncbi:helix-turn-helix domain-containing protein [Actinacidiphila oryziradicis]|uniref:Helix-turn-helix domain-containing protein n=1 Tax=Actinacidiphila oryziradicis TaxID=2571141 RepID=A0A4U0SN17_9ACTN|nr:helix-turn-helix transcriptional regulator [Actinacidiphila oryziradicis]TKA11364.1 helix-turn-helix domain-containing protein [Actinacidiphila oryziradicis]